jgi:hypothetical protein
LLANGIMFYNDLFMWFFFALTLWVIEKNPNSKWIFLLTAITVLSKFYSVLLLIPLYFSMNYKKSDITKNVIIISVMVVVIFIIVQAILAKDILYQYHHWSALRDISSGNIIRNILPNLWSYVSSWGLWLSIPLVLTGLCFAVIYKNKSYYSFVAFGLIVLVCSMGWGFYPYHVYPIMYVAMFAIPSIIKCKKIEKDY